MRKPLLLLTLLTLFALPVWAQSAKVYQADNFDIPNSVHVETPTPKPPPTKPRRENSKETDHEPKLHLQSGARFVNPSNESTNQPFARRVHHRRCERR